MAVGGAKRRETSREEICRLGDGKSQKQQARDEGRPERQRDSQISEGQRREAVQCPHRGNNVALGTGAVDGGEEVMEDGEEEGVEEEEETVPCGGGSQITRGRGRADPQ